MRQVIFPIIPQVCDLERMKQGGEHWQWSPETPLYMGVLPRHGAKPTDVKVCPILPTPLFELPNNLLITPSSGLYTKTPSPATPQTPTKTPAQKP